MSDRKPFHKARLIRMADMLDGVGPYEKVGPVPDHKFDMQYLYCLFAGGDHICQAEFNPRKCKTAACGLGWARSDPWFRKKGVNRTGAIYSFFGITYGKHGEENIPFDDEFSYMFEAESYSHGREVSQHVVAARIREVAAR